MVETGPGLVKMSNPPGTHDDVLTVVGMIVADLTDSPEIGGGGFSNPREIDAQMQARQLAAGGSGMGGSLLNPAYAARRTRGDLAAVYASQRAQSEA
jgi:sirohydrochlorin ferrochelatase